MGDQPRSVTMASDMPISALDVSPSGDQFLVGQRHVTLWSMPSWEMVLEVEDPEERIILAARYAPSGETIAFSGAATEVTFYDIASRGKRGADLENSSVQWLSYAANCDRLVIAGTRTQVWDGRESRVVWTLSGQAPEHHGEVSPMLAALSPDGRLVAASGAEPGEIDIFDVDTGSVRQRLKEAPDQVRALSIDPQGRFVAAIGLNSNGAYLWDIATGRKHLPDVFRADVEGWWCLRFSPDGHYIAVGMLSGFVRVIGLDDGESVVRERAHQGRVWDLSFAPDGKRLFSGGDDAVVYIWELSQ